MTLIVASLAQGLAVLAADRRLTVNGRVVEERATKLTVLATPSARAAVAYTGLARVGTFSTDDWIVSTLGSMSFDELGGLDAIAQDLADRCNSVVGGLPIKPQQRQLSIALCGYSYAVGVAPQPRLLVVSNFENSLSAPSFSAREIEVKTWIGGATAAIDRRAREEILRLETHLSAGRQRAVEITCDRLITAASNHSASGGTVGRFANVAVVPSEPGSPIATTYFSPLTTSECFSPNVVLRGPDGYAFTSQGTRMVRSSGPPLAVPRSRRNEPCKCGSGYKYKVCHGAVRENLASFVRLQYPDAAPSGSQLFVSATGAFH